MGVPINENLRMSMQDYLAYPALSSSALAMADESLAKFHAYRNGKIRYESKALDLGTAVHTMLENPDEFKDCYIAKPQGMDYRTKEGKQFKEENQWKNIIDAETYATVLGCYEAWMTADDRLIKIARQSHGEAEISRLFHLDDILCKARADRLVDVQGEDNEWLAEHWPSLFNPISNRIIVDFKTTSRSAAPTSFRYACRDFHYLTKAAFYLEAFKADAFMWVVLETSPPYHITRYLMSSESVEFHTARMKFLIQRIKECEASGVWPGLYVDDLETLL